MASCGEIQKRLKMLKCAMREAGIHAYLMTSSDYHASEYVGDFFKVSEYFSGCTSDNVVFIVEENSAKLWTDGRYFISAGRELKGTEIELMKMGESGVPTVQEYLSSMLDADLVLGFDGRCVSATDGKAYRRIAQEKGARVDGTLDFAERLWLDRPQMPEHPITVLGDELTGESFQQKAERVRGALAKENASYLILSKLDDIMWLFNIRGADIACNPVAISYAILGQGTADLFLENGEVTDEVRSFARANRIKLHPYEEFFDYIRDYHFEGRVFVDEKASSDSLMNLLMKRAEVVCGTNPTTVMKAVKNETELEKSRYFYIEDSVAVCRFIYWLKTRIGRETITEVSAAQKIDAIRAAIPGYLDLSFGTISAYNANAAMAHYAPEEETCSTLEEKGFLLVDSGAQYLGGTTDVTRTIALGALSDAMKRDFTLVAMANLRLLYAKFPYGCTGINLDTFARAPLWEAGIDYNHGTGHGIGYILNVHEGPQSIRFREIKGAKNWVFEKGMITSDEPGIYRENQWGIRTESIVECVEAEETEFGKFMRFEPLTYVPIDLDAIDVSLMSSEDVKKLNRYHRDVYETIAPHLEGEELAWLKEATRPVEGKRDMA